MLFVAVSEYQRDLRRRAINVFRADQSLNQFHKFLPAVASAGPRVKVRSSYQRQRFRRIGYALPDTIRRRVSDFRNQLQHALPRQLVVRVDYDAKVRDDILDMRLLEEAHARTYHVRNVP